MQARGYLSNTLSLPQPCVLHVKGKNKCWFAGTGEHSLQFDFWASLQFGAIMLRHTQPCLSLWDGDSIHPLQTNPAINTHTNTHTRDRAHGFKKQMCPDCKSFEHKSQNGIKTKNKSQKEAQTHNLGGTVNQKVLLKILIKHFQS